MPVCLLNGVRAEKLPQTILTKKTLLYVFLIISHNPSVRPRSPSLFSRQKTENSLSSESEEPSLSREQDSPPPGGSPSAACHSAEGSPFSHPGSPPAGTQDSGAYYFTAQLSVTAERRPGGYGGRGTFYRPVQQILGEVLFYI